MTRRGGGFLVGASAGRRCDREIATFEFEGDLLETLEAAVKGLSIVIVWELEKRG